MLNRAYGEVLKVWIFVGAVVLLGAWTTTFWYNAGRALGEVTADKVTNGFFRELGVICRGAELPEFFGWSMWIMAALWFFPFLRAVNFRGYALREPMEGGVGKGVLVAVGGLVLASGTFGLMGLVMVKLGWFVIVGTPTGLWRILGTVVMEEWLFRGVIMGLFLWAMPVRRVLVMMAVLFAGIHFLNPPPGFNVPDPDASGVGLELLGRLLARLGEPQVWCVEVLPLLGMGWILAAARWRTGTWWLSAGVHLGWALANGWVLAAVRSAGPGSWLVGDSLWQGLIPLAGVAVTGLLLYFLTRPEAEPPIDDA